MDNNFKYHKIYQKRHHILAKDNLILFQVIHISIILKIMISNKKVEHISKFLGDTFFGGKLVVLRKNVENLQTVI